MLQLVFWIGVVALVGYFLRRNFRRAWYVVRTGDANPDWEKLGGDYFIAPWERKRALKNSAEKGEAKKEASKTPADAVGK
jgi:hypothetical protein